MVRYPDWYIKNNSKYYKEIDVQPFSALLQFKGFSKHSSSHHCLFQNILSEKKEIYPVQLKDFGWMVQNLEMQRTGIFDHHWHIKKHSTVFYLAPDKDQQ